MPKAISDLVLSGPLWNSAELVVGPGGLPFLEREVWLLWHSALSVLTWRTLGRGGAAGVGRGRRLPTGLQPGTNLVSFGKAARPLSWNGNLTRQCGPRGPSFGQGTSSFSETPDQAPALAGAWMVWKLQAPSPWLDHGAPAKCGEDRGPDA